jgi:hypothetical protein
VIVADNLSTHWALKNFIQREERVLCTPHRKSILCVCGG